MRNRGKFDNLNSFYGFVIVCVCVHMTTTVEYLAEEGALHETGSSCGFVRALDCALNAIKCKSFLFLVYLDPYIYLHPVCVSTYFLVPT